MNATEMDAVVTRVLAGDIDAYEEIVRSYQQEVWRVVAAMLFNTQKTEDLVQQTFINAYEHLHQFERGRDFGAWIKQIARNQVRQEIRRCQREDRRLELYFAQLVRMYEGPGTSVNETALEEALIHCTEKLPPNSARLVELRYQAALNFGEIASLMGRTIEATRQQLARVRQALREYIEKGLANI